MTEKTSLPQNLTQLPVRWTDLEAVTKRINGHVSPKFKGLGSDATLLRAMGIRGFKHVQPSVPDQRVFIHVQTKNKHPHSTKKHK